MAVEFRGSTRRRLAPLGKVRHTIVGRSGTTTTRMGVLRDGRGVSAMGKLQ
ncbi:sorbosone dehydrogenase [Sesbania bispinosa]|nr:sorbosone dehydrogenase [Sesbania bispinosa]